MGKSPPVQRKSLATPMNLSTPGKILQAPMTPMTRVNIVKTRTLTKVHILSSRTHTQRNRSQRRGLGLDQISAYELHSWSLVLKK